MALYAESERERERDTTSERGIPRATASLAARIHKVAKITEDARHSTREREKAQLCCGYINPRACVCFFIFFSFYASVECYYMKIETFIKRGKKLNVFNFKKKERKNNCYLIYLHWSK